jgi:hypothetical protein
MQIFIWILATYGIIFLLMESEIFSPIRDYITKASFFDKLFSCSFCMGTWVSFLLYVFVNIKSNFKDFSLYSNCVLYTFSGATGVYFISKVLDWLEISIIYKQVDLQETMGQEDEEELN